MPQASYSLFAVRCTLSANNAFFAFGFSILVLAAFPPGGSGKFLANLFFQKPAQAKLHSDRCPHRILTDRIVRPRVFCLHYLNNFVSDNTRLARTRDNLVEHQTQKTPIHLEHRRLTVIEVFRDIGVPPDYLGPMIAGLNGDDLDVKWL